MRLTQLYARLKAAATSRVVEPAVYWSRIARTVSVASRWLSCRAEWMEEAPRELARQ